MSETKPEPQQLRGNGTVFVRGKFAWIKFYHRGRVVRESTKILTSSANWEKRAENFLNDRRFEIKKGLAPLPSSKRLRYQNLRDSLLINYENCGHKWLRIGRDGQPYVPGLKWLNQHFAGWRHNEIAIGEIEDYVAERKKQKAKNGTINRELALLHRMYALAVEQHKLSQVDVPQFPERLKESDPREGFISHAEYVRLRGALPEYLRPLISLCYWTGMRQGEAKGLKWSEVDLEARTILLPGRRTKNGKGRTLSLPDEPWEMLKIERERNPGAEWVFLRDGDKIQSFRKAWTSSAKRAGLSSLLPHDLRRSAVRNLIRSGVSEKVAMDISGHKDRSVFERYNVTSESDLKDAAAKVQEYLSGSELGHKSDTIDHSTEVHGTTKKEEVPTVQ